VLDDAIANVDENELRVEREVVRQELRLRTEMSYSGNAWNELMRAVFPKGHPYSRAPVGTHESLDAITLEDVRAFAGAHYRPENATIILLGDVDASKIARLGARVFSAADEDAFTWTVQARAEHLEAILELLHEQVTSIEVPSRGLLFWREHSLPRMGRAGARPEAIAERAFFATIEGAYGRPATATELGRVDVADVDRWVKGALSADDATLVIVGGIDEGADEAAVRKQLAALPRAAPVTPPPSTSQRVLVLPSRARRRRSCGSAACYHRPTCSTTSNTSCSPRSCDRSWRRSCVRTSARPTR
jgi:predicted Zn-dependent peptidase